MTIHATEFWEPVLQGDRAEAAWKAVWEVSDALTVFDWSKQNPSLSSGSAGAALLFGYLAKVTGEAGALSNCRMLMDIAGGMLAGQASDCSLFAGFPGIGWAANHLHDLLDPASEDPASEIDDAVILMLDRPEWHDSYDLIIGLVGHGVYALERLKTEAGREILARVVRHLDRLAVPKDGGFAWFTPAWQLPPWQRELAPEGYWNLGLAHGIPGVLALLGRAIKADVESATAKRLLEGGMAWLLAHRNIEGGEGWFANSLPEGQQWKSRDSRVAWCYGDLGLSAALLMASRDAGRTDWEAEALRIARDAAARPRVSRGIRDSGLCHGTAGNALIFLRLYHATGETCFLDSALDHLDWTLEFRDPGKPYGGFPKYCFDDHKPSMGFFPGLLEGNAGVALVLLAALTNQAPDWDRHFLISLDPRSRA